MELDPRNPLLTLNYFCQGKSAEELKQMVICANVELQTIRLQAQEEIRKRDDELRKFRSVLSKVVKEKDEAREKFQCLLLEKFSQVVSGGGGGGGDGMVSGVTSINNEDEVKRGLESGNNGLSASEEDESTVSSPVVDDTFHPPRSDLQYMIPESTLSSHEDMMELLIREQKALPEKGKLLDAIINAGPLLQTLLLAGPLPQWRHPPPPMESSQIPLVAIPPSPLYSRDKVDRKRNLIESSDSSTKTKYQRILLS